MESSGKILPFPTITQTDRNSLRQPRSHIAQLRNRETA
ncbi:hypothetical protein APS_2331 [Acetobacter pasteurianus subsp. pasteurianus LMG 1262 = NBRC 106471]|nr:hypothetical protein APS_2331 [Acetobacter pasteurianus subsp. pasteurianus LMG 1262 = NBRC 106471]